MILFRAAPWGPPDHGPVAIRCLPTKFRPLRQSAPRIRPPHRPPALAYVPKNRKAVFALSTSPNERAPSNNPNALALSGSCCGRPRFIDDIKELRVASRFIQTACAPLLPDVPPLITPLRQNLSPRHHKRCGFFRNWLFHRSENPGILAKPDPR